MEKAGEKGGGGGGGGGEEEEGGERQSRDVGLRCSNR